MNRRAVEIRTKLVERMEQIAHQEDLSIGELVDHVLRSYAEEFVWDDEDVDDQDSEDEE